MSKIIYQRPIGPAIRRARERAGLLQGELAELIFKSPATISGIERGAMRPKLPTLIAIANVLGTSLDDLIGRTVPPPANVVGLGPRRRAS